MRHNRRITTSTLPKGIVSHYGIMTLYVNGTPIKHIHIQHNVTWSQNL